MYFLSNFFAYYDDRAEVMGQYKVVTMAVQVFLMNTSTPFICTLIGLVITQHLTQLFLNMSQWGSARAMFTKTVHPREVGSVFSAVAILSALMPMVGGPVFRGLYNSTIETLPSAFLLLGRAIEKRLHLCFAPYSILQVMQFTLKLLEQ